MNEDAQPVTQPAPEPESAPVCCLDNTHTRHYSDGYTQICKTHGTQHTTDTGWNR